MGVFAGKPQSAHMFITRDAIKGYRVARNGEMCYFLSLGCECVINQPLCASAERHLENRELLHTTFSVFPQLFLRLPPSPSWGYLYFPFGNTSMMTLQLIPDVRGEGLRQTLAAESQNELKCPPYSPSAVSVASSSRSARFNPHYFVRKPFGGFFLLHSVMQMEK